MSAVWDTVITISSLTLYRTSAPVHSGSLTTTSPFFYICILLSVLGEALCKVGYRVFVDEVC